MKAARLIFEFICMLGLLCAFMLILPVVWLGIAVAWMFSGREKNAPHARDPRGYYAHPEAR